MALKKELLNLGDELEEAFPDVSKALHLASACAGGATIDVLRLRVSSRLNDTHVASSA